MITILVPVFNEKESLEAFYKELSSEVSKLKTDFEILFIDDGSSDGSVDILKKFEKDNRSVKIFSFRRNQGKAEALTLGFEKARGDYIITLDADLQDKPSEISKILGLLQLGNDVVCGWRKNRQDSKSKVISSGFFNFLISFFSKLKLHDYNCGLKGYSRVAAKSLKLYGGMHRFIPLLCHQQGFRVAEVPILHGERKFGKSKYGFSKLWKDLPDIFTMLFLKAYGRRPLHFFGLVGGITIFSGIIILGYLSYIHFQGETIGNRPLLFLGMLLVIGGFQVFFTGLLADLIINSQSSKSMESDKSLIRYESK